MAAKRRLQKLLLHINASSGTSTRMETETAHTESTSTESESDVRGPSFPVQIVAMGRFLPPRVVASAEVEDATTPPLPRGWSERRSGVAQRHWVGPEETNATMAAAAIRDALERAQMTVDDLDLVVNASGTSMRHLPDNAPFIQAALGLGDSGVPAFSVTAGCLSFVVAMDVVASLIATGRYATVAVVSSEITSRGLDFEDPETATLFGDGAAAAIVRRTPPGEASCLYGAVLETYGNYAEQTTVRGGGTERAGLPLRHPEDTTFRMEGRRVLRSTMDRSLPFLERVCPGITHGMSQGVSFIVPHQPSKAALKNAEFFGWPSEQVGHTLRVYGNCVAASIPLTLCDAVEKGRVKRGDRVLCIGSGAGLSLGGWLLVW